MEPWEEIRILPVRADGKTMWPSQCEEWVRGHLQAHRGVCWQQRHDDPEASIFHHANTGAGDGTRVNTTKTRHYLCNHSFNVSAIAAGWIPGSVFGEASHLTTSLPAGYNAMWRSCGRETQIGKDPLQREQQVGRHQICKPVPPLGSLYRGSSEWVIT